MHEDAFKTRQAEEITLSRARNIFSAPVSRNSTFVGIMKALLHYTREVGMRYQVNFVD